ncbi:DUF72 domain-containing protein [Lentzea sp. CA-135723]|uniref:DUF72 domain-containing protein n=1 Tax=Lentzea sp. CA-135723 TaxID=3239950 RepID=UPI003D8AF0FC
MAAAALPALRPHGGPTFPYIDDEQLSTWAEKIHEQDRDTYVYFDNTMHGAAPLNALRLAHLLRERSHGYSVQI